MFERHQSFVRARGNFISLSCFLLDNLHRMFGSVVIAGIALKLKVLFHWSGFDIEICIAARVHCLPVEEVDVDGEYVCQSVAHHWDRHCDMSASRRHHYINTSVHHPTEIRTGIGAPLTSTHHWGKDHAARNICNEE